MGDSKEFTDFLNRARLEMFPKMKSSAMSLVLATGEVDAKLAIELGAALLYDKPLIFLIKKGTKISPRLRMIVDEWIEFEDINHPETKAKITSALLRVAKRSSAD